MLCEFNTHPNFDPNLAKGFFINKGWQVSFKPVTPGDLKPIKEGADLNCMDERTENGIDDHDGAKLPGGGYFIMGEKTGGHKEGLYTARQIIEDSGLVTGIHGDDQHNELGCGVCNLWNSQKMPFRHKLQVDPKEIVDLVQSPYINGRYRRLNGPHTASQLMINPITGMTAPKDGTSLIVDFGYALSIGLEPGRVLYLAAYAVEALGLPRKATILQAA